MVDENKLQHLIDETVSGKHTFQEHLVRLLPLGVNGYQIDLENIKAHYYGERESNVVYPLPLDTSLSFGSKWAPDKIKEAIIKVQKKEIGYQSFLQAIAKAGVRRYTVDLQMKMTIYFGGQHEFIEPFPQVLCDLLNLHLHRIDKES